MSLPQGESGHLPSHRPISLLSPTGASPDGLIHELRRLAAAVAHESRWWGGVASDVYAGFVEGGPRHFWAEKVDQDSCDRGGRQSRAL